MTAAEAKTLRDQANKAGVVHAVTFNYRGNPLVQQARHADRARRHRHAALRPRPLPAGLAAQGHRLLVAARARQGRRVVGARRHRIALVRSGAARERPAHHARARRHHDGHPEAQEADAARARRSPPPAPNDEVELVDIKVEDLASVLVRFDNGAKGVVLGRPGLRRPQERLRLEVCGSTASLRWGRRTRTSSGSAIATRPTRSCRRIPSLLDAEVRGYAHLPGGHQEAWADAFCNLMRDIYGFIAAGKKPTDAHPPAFATFEDGYRANVHRRGDSREREAGQRLDEGELLSRCRSKPFDPKFMKVGVLTAALQELTPREVRDPDPDGRSRTGSRSRRSSAPSYIQLSAALHPTETDVPPEAMLDPVANTLDLRAAVRQGARARASQAALDADRRRPLGRRLLRQHAAPRPGDPQEEARLHAARVRRGGAARRRRRLRLRRPQPAAQHGPEPASTSRSTSCRC